MSDGWCRNKSCQHIIPLAVLAIVLDVGRCDDVDGGVCRAINLFDSINVIFAAQLCSCGGGEELSWHGQQKGTVDHRAAMRIRSIMDATYAAFSRSRLKVPTENC